MTKEFTRKCQLCGEKLKGQEEANKHAEKNHDGTVAVGVI